MRASIVAALLLCSLPPQTSADDLHAGAAVVDITPPLGYAMWGYASRRDSPSVGVLDRLKARAVVLDTGKARLAIVSLDLGRPPTRESTAAIRGLVKDAGIDHVLLCASHTHHGPVLELRDWPAKDECYVAALEKQLANLILLAASKRTPARLGVVRKDLPYNRNRHTKRTEKPTDPELIVVRVENMEGKALAHLVNFAAHPTMLPRELNKFSADFPGPLSRTVEAAEGGVCLFLQGACGDLSTRPVDTSGHEEFGVKLASEVLKLAKDCRCTIREADLQFRERDFRFGKRVDLGNPFLRAAVAAAFFEKLVDFYEREYREGIRPHMSVALLDEQIGIVGVSGEFFSAHAVALKQRARLPYLLFVGYCNDFQQYFPTIEAAAEGGYGADALTSPVEIGAGEQMMNRALIDLYEMRGRLRNFD